HIARPIFLHAEIIGLVPVLTREAQEAPAPRPPAPETDAGRAGARGEDRTRKTESIVRSPARRLTAGGTDFRATEPPRSGRTIRGPRRTSRRRLCRATGRHRRARL